MLLAIYLEMRRSSLAVTLLVTTSLLGCSEEPQRLTAAEKPGYATDDWRDQLRSRAQRQNEASRIYP